jgi:hypothetical protein
MRGGAGPVANKPNVKTTQSPSKSKSHVYSLDGCGAIFENTPANFVRTVRTLPGLASPTPLAVSFYSRQHDSSLPAGVRALTETILYTEGPPNSMYMNDIAKHMFNTVEEWTLVAHPRASKPPPHWPPNAKISAPQAPIGKEKLPDIARQILPPIPQHQLPQFNKPRIIQPQIAKKPAVKFDPWIAEEHRLDRLQRDSWWKDQSVVEPGRKPEAPYFGHPREMMLTLGSNLPTIYAQRLTPTDIGQLLDENQRLRNTVLERMENCNLCDVTFPMYEIEKIREHYKEHIEQIRSAGLCPMCGDDAWIFLSQDERKSHLEEHQNYNELEKMKNFWKDLQCPVCDIDLSKRKSDEILQHVADHQPGLIRFCDRCSLDLKDCCQAELENHQKNCLDYDRNDTPQFGDLQVPIFCDKCGKDRTFESEEESISHTNYCCGFARSFCRTCGVDFNFLTHDQCARHSVHCYPPRGHRKTFCKRCSTNLTTLNPMMKASHDQDCYFQEPGQQSVRDRTSGVFSLVNFRPDANIVMGLEEIIVELRKREAKNSSFIAHIRQREENFEGETQQSQQPHRNSVSGETIAEEMLRRLPELQAAADRLTEKVGLYKKATGEFDTLVGDTGTQKNSNERSPKKAAPSTKKVRIETPPIHDVSDNEDATSVEFQLLNEDFLRLASPKKSTVSFPKKNGKRKFASVEEVPDESLQPKKPTGRTPRSKKTQSNQDSEFEEPEYFKFDLADSAAAATPRRNTRSASPAPTTTPKSKKKKLNVDKEYKDSPWSEMATVMPNTMAELTVEIGTPAPANTPKPKKNVNEDVDGDEEYNEDLLLEMEIANTIAGLIRATTAENGARPSKTTTKSKKQKLDTDKAYKELEYFAEMAAAMGAAEPRRNTRSAGETPARRTKKQKLNVDQAYTDNPLIETETESEAETTTVAPRRTTRSTSEIPATKTKKQKANVDKAYKDESLVELDTGDVIIESGRTKRGASQTPASETVPKSKKRKLDVDTENSLILMDTGAEISEPRRRTRAASGTPAPRTVPKSKKQKADLDKNEPFTTMATEPRRSTRAASGTPAPGTRAVSEALDPAATGKKAGRPRKTAVDVDVVIEKEEKGISGSPVKRRMKSNSPGKNLVDVEKECDDEPLIEMVAEPRRSTRAVSGTPAPRTRIVGETPAPATAEKKVGRSSKKVVDAVLEEEEEEDIPSSPVKRKGPRKKAK